MENTIQEIACPVCEAEGTHIYNKDGFHIARCAECKTLFVENPPRDTSFVYDAGYFFGSAHGGGYGSYDAEKETMRRTFEQCLDMIAEHKQGGSLFDVGAATGYFLAIARERGYQVSGIDISPAATEEAKKKGIDVATGTFETIHYPENAFNVVTMFDVLEHVPSPRSLLAHAQSILKTGGIVMGSTPDSGSINARLMGKRWHMLFPPEHLVLMNDRSLRLALAKEGFETLWTGRITKRFSLSYILQTAARWLKIPVLSRIGLTLRGTLLGRIAIPLDLRDNVFFLARKRA